MKKLFSEEAQCQETPKGYPWSRLDLRTGNQFQCWRDLNTNGNGRASIKDKFLELLMKPVSSRALKNAGIIILVSVNSAD